MAQAIAILTVAMTYDRAVIVIDEISSFLHPAAAKALLRILQTNYSQHQYIVSTHSPEVLAAGNPATVHLVRRQGYDSTVERIDLDKLEQLRDVASHLGVSMTDVFGAERIIWVEGATEEICLPYIIYKDAVGPLPRGLAVTPVIAIGDFNAKVKRKDLIFQIYERLSKAAHPLVKSVCFSFDRETLTEKQMADLKKGANGRVMFLPRRHFECFLLDPAAVAAFIEKRAPDLGQQITPDVVEKYIQSIGGKDKFQAAKKWKADINDEDWLAEVDAANLLKQVCEELTEGRVTFAKNRDLLELLQHIMTENRPSLDGLIAYIRSLLELAKAGSE